MMPTANAATPAIGFSTIVCGRDTSIFKNPTSATRSVVKKVIPGTAASVKIIEYAAKNAADEKVRGFAERVAKQHKEFVNVASGHAKRLNIAVVTDPDGRKMELTFERFGGRAEAIYEGTRSRGYYTADLRGSSVVVTIGKGDGHAGRGQGFDDGAADSPASTGHEGHLAGQAGVYERRWFHPEMQ